MIYIVDIDNTICSTPVIDGEHSYNNSSPYIDRISKINDLYKSGHVVIYWTARGSSTGKDWEELTKTQLSNWGALYTEVKFKKPSYDVWIDDKAFNSEVYFDVK